MAVPRQSQPAGWWPLQADASRERDGIPVAIL